MKAIGDHMPIRPDLRHFYGREWKRVIRPRILARDRNRCKRCKAPNGIVVWRAKEGRWRFTECGASWHRANGNKTTFEPMDSHQVRIVLTIAHLNHNPSDNRDENLAALCQWCHLAHDKDHHAETRATRKDQARPLLSEQALPPSSVLDQSIEGLIEHIRHDIEGGSRP